MKSQPFTDYCPMLEHHLTQIFSCLRDADVRYILVGGLAVAAHGHVRFTADVDLVVALDAKNASATLFALGTLGYLPAVPVTPAMFGDAEVRASWVKEKQMIVFPLRSDLQPETCIDLFIEEPFDFEKEFTSALRIELLPGVLVPVVSLNTLIAMKQAAGRPRDLDDIMNLKLGQSSE